MENIHFSFQLPEGVKFSPHLTILGVVAKLGMGVRSAGWSAMQGNLEWPFCRWWRYLPSQKQTDSTQVPRRSGNAPRLWLPRFERDTFHFTEIRWGRKMKDEWASAGERGLYVPLFTPEVIPHGLREARTLWRALVPP